MRIFLSVALLAALLHCALPQNPVPLVTGKRITPQGRQTEVGSFPANMILSPDGRYVIVTNTGYRQFLTVLSAMDGRIVSRLPFNQNRTDGVNRKQALYFGLQAVAEPGDEGATVYFSRGSEGKVSLARLDSAGKLTMLPEERKGIPAGPKAPVEIAGIAYDGRTLFAADNYTGPESGMKGGVFLFEPGAEPRRIELPGFPFAAACTTAGSAPERKLYVASERDGVVSVIDPFSARVRTHIRVGEQPQYLLMKGDQTKLFVANSGSDTVSIIDTRLDRVVRTLQIRPDDVRGLPGATPTGLALSPNDRRLYVTLGDMNAVAVVDLPSSRLVGYIPVGWYPTSAVVSADNRRLFVANGKGVNTRNPNAKDVGDRGRYIQNIIEGTVSTIPVPDDASLARLTAQTLLNNLQPLSDTAIGRPLAARFRNPGIRHVIYVIKENRTYDQVLGDLPKGNGDPSVCLFPREVTPNQHALAERFVLLDNFYCCAEVSADGWQWSVSGMVSAYTSRNTPYNYSGRGRTYDQEGQNWGVAVDLEGIKDVSRPASGYFWDLCAKKGLSYRNYGFYLSFGDPDEISMESRPKAVDNTPNKKALVGHTDLDFRIYDMRYADSDAWVKHNCPAPNQLRAYGRYNAPSRIAEWKREFDQFVKNRNLPRFMMVRLPRDHTSGTTPGASSPRAMVADNDYAVGQLVESVSRSPYWRSTAICILEDDAQNGFDHVDAHRSIAFVVSPFVKRGSLDSRFYNTDSMLRTMGLLLGLPPLCQYDAVANPIAVFGERPDNLEPYTAILPKREIVAEVNRATAYRAKDSARLLNPYKEESDPDEELNDILWRAIKGSAPKPPIRYNMRVSFDSRPRNALRKPRPNRRASPVR